MTPLGRDLSHFKFTAVAMATGMLFRNLLPCSMFADNFKWVQTSRRRLRNKFQRRCKSRSSHQLFVTAEQLLYVLTKHCYIRVIKNKYVMITNTIAVPGNPKFTFATRTKIVVGMISVKHSNRRVFSATATHTRYIIVVIYFVSYPLHNHDIIIFMCACINCHVL